MKRILLLAAGLVAVVGITQAQSSLVSERAQAQLLADFPGVGESSWVHGKVFDEATFIQHGVLTTAYYDNMSNLVGSTVEKTVQDLPENARKQLNKHWLSKGYTVDRVILFDDNEANETDMLLYDNPFNDADNYFIELHNSNKKIILQSDMEGLVTFFKALN